MDTKAKNKLQVASVGAIMAGSIVTVLVVAWLGDARNEPREYVPAASVAQAE